MAVITLDIDPLLELGPLTLSWHGLGIALGIFVGGMHATRYARFRNLEREQVVNLVIVIALAGIVGARAFYLLLNEPGDLLRPGEWLSGNGFAFYGALILGIAAVAVFVRRERLSAHYLDALAYGFPLGMAVGRIGDVINGEHYGPASDAPWAFRLVHPEADVPSASVAYHNGGFYEMVMALVMLPLVLLLARRLRRPGALLGAVVALYGAGRFVIFFYRSDTDDFAVGINVAQATGLALVVLGALGVWVASRRPSRPRASLGAQQLIAALAVAVVLLAAAGCGGDEQPDPSPVRTDAPVVEDPGPVHVHGLGVNPGTGSLFIATHTGLFEADKGQLRARRVGDRYQDTMAFTVIGRDRFLGSGHPDGRDGLPPFLGLIESRDAGRSWRPRSLQGRADFHVLEALGDRVYGFGSDFETREQTFLASENGGRSWTRLRAPEALLDLAVDPSDSSRLLASGNRGLHLSTDAGRRWRPVGGEPGLLAWPRRGGPYLLGQDGVVRVAADGLRAWRAAGQLGGPPSAFASGPAGELYAALHDGTVKRSGDGGASWSVRSRP